MSRTLTLPTEERFTSRLRSPAVAARIGVWLAVTFTLCFVTGLISHYAQNVDHPVAFPTGPAWGYRFTQGLHVISGYAAVPLLLVKLWTVLPRLFQAVPLSATCAGWCCTAWSASRSPCWSARRSSSWSRGP